MFLGGGGARPGGKLCWLAPPLFCCCCWIWLGVSRKWNCRKNWKQENRKPFIELFSAQKLSSKATDDHMILHFCFICSWKMHKSIPAVPRSPPPRATAEHLPTLWVPGVGHLQILRCPGVRHLPTQGQPQVFDRRTVSYQKLHRAFYWKNKQIGSFVKDGKKLKRFVKACSWFYACTSSLLIKPE